MRYDEIINEVRRRLNSANKKFAAQIKTNADISSHYVDIGFGYQEIVKFIQENSTGVSPALETYRLSAELGLLQCKMNSFKLSPLTKEAVKKNDSQLSKLSKKNQQLLKSTLDLEEKFKLESISEQDEYLILKEQIYSYNNNWKEKEFNLRAAYYYNYADFLLHKSPRSTESINEAIDFFKDSSNFYAENGKETEKKQTDDKIAETEKLFAKLQLNHLKKCVAKIKSKYKGLSPKTPTTNRFDNPSIDPATKETNMLKTSEQSNFLLIHSTVINPKRHESSLESDDKLLPPKKRRTETVASENISVSNEELIRLENKTFAEIATSLELKNSTQFHFYFSLINILASFIPIRSHQDKLTKLQLSEMVADFINVFLNSQLSEQPLPIIEKNLNTIYQLYKNCAWDPSPAKELREIKLIDNGLACLFISEVKAYYFSQKALKTDNESRKIVLNEVANIVGKSIETSLVKQSIETISSHLRNLPIESENQLLKNLLKTIEAFYMSPDQDRQNWLEANNIPIKTSNPSYQDFLGKLYDLINLHSTSGVQRIEFSPNGVPKLYFFQPKAIVFTKEIFLTRFKEHLLMLKRDYIPSNNKYSAICHYLTQLITTQMEQQLAIDRDPVCPLSYPRVSV
ncbi:MAG: hypothetical protein RJA83_458 [Pseudomonadota bacterium]